MDGAGWFVGNEGARTACFPGVLAISAEFGPLERYWARTSRNGLAENVSMSLTKGRPQHLARIRRLWARTVAPMVAT